MKSQIFYALTLAAMIACATPAHADWEGTQWGMSPDEALAVLDGAKKHSPEASEILEYDGASYKPLLQLDHLVEGIEGEASLLFDADERLQFVVFSPADRTRCDALTAALSKVYGAVVATGFGSTAIYNWVDANAVIRLTNSPDIEICNLSYGVF